MHSQWRSTRNCRISALTPLEALEFLVRAAMRERAGTMRRRERVAKYSLSATDEEWGAPG